MVLTRRILLASLILCVACGEGGSGYGEWSGEKREDYALPVRVVRASRSDVEDYVETQANLESDVYVTVLAEAEGRILKRHSDVGDRVGESGKPPFLLATMDDRDYVFALKDAEISVEEAIGRGQELALDFRRNTRLLEQANIAVAEAQAVLVRTSNGLNDGTISLEEQETATFALNRAQSTVHVAQAAKDKAELAVKLNGIAERKAEVARDRAKLALERTLVRSPMRGVVTACNVREGQIVKVGQELYRIEDTSRLVAYGDIPVRQAKRIRKANVVRIGSSAAPKSTHGRVALVEPTVDSAAGTVRVKISVTASPGFKPGLFVAVRIVVAERKNALVLPKRCVLHHDEDGTYVFVIENDKATRVLVKTGFERGDYVEILEGIDDVSQVVVEGQDTLTDTAKVEIKK